MSRNDKPINCQGATEKLLDWLNNDLSADDRARLDTHLAQCPDCRQELSATRHLWQQMVSIPAPEPGPAMNTRFYAMLDAFEAAEKPAQSALKATLTGWFGYPWSSVMAGRLAFSLLLLSVGGGLGYWLSAAQKPTVAYQQRIDTLSVQVQEMREMMMLSLLENPSATERLRAVGYTKEISDVDTKVIDALLMTLNNDANVNVRLVTLEALAQLAGDARVREGLVQSLTRQESPLVQIALADIMVKLQEKRSLKPLRQLLRQRNLNDLVKSKLEQTIRELS